MFRNKSVDVHKFSMVPRADIPRSVFNIQHTHKTTFDSSFLIPIYVDEVLPGDSFNLRMTAFARMSTPLFPVMDNMHMDTFFFFVPNRLVWDNWQKFMGEQRNPGDSISYLVPQVTSPAGGYPIGSIFDYFGLPTVGQVDATSTISHSALPLRAYSLIYNEWFRDENLQNSILVPTNDGPDPSATYALQRRGKRHDYFTSALPWPQKGQSVTLPLGGTAPVIGNPADATPVFMVDGASRVLFTDGGSGNIHMSPVPTNNDSQAHWANSGLVADLSAATAATINQLRQSFQIQKLLERDARGGTRYTELIRAHFGVVSPDARLQRPEYLGGGSTPVNVSPIAQTSGSAATPGGYTDTPLGNLAAIGTVLARNHGFSQSFTEHGHIIGLAMVRADLTYQQGIRHFWKRSTRYDFYFPAFAMLGERSILNREIYCTGLPADDLVFGYQERWSEYRYMPSMITSLFRSTAFGTLDAWHLAQRFNDYPQLNNEFISEAVPLERALAVGSAANGQQFIFDSFFSCRAVRPLPMYSVPGLIDHF
ncbi:MAG: major capsid protein [Microviridae sp.]|nr:MAG: major capsid protein [Microviridae sp.]